VSSGDDLDRLLDVLQQGLGCAEHEEIKAQLQNASGEAVPRAVSAE